MVMDTAMMDPTESTCSVLNSTPMEVIAGALEEEEEVLEEEVLEEEARLLQPKLLGVVLEVTSARARGMMLLTPVPAPEIPALVCTTAT